MIFLTGPHGAGKTTVAKILTRHNFNCLELGEILRKRHQAESLKISFQTWCAQNEKSQGVYFTDSVIVGEIRKKCKEALKSKTPFQDLIIVGSRSFRGIQYITKRIPLLNERGNVIIFIDAPLKILKKRYCVREERRLTWNEFRAILNNDTQMGLAGIGSVADIRVLNVGSKRELEARIERIIFGKLGYQRQ